MFYLKKKKIFSTYPYMANNAVHVNKDPANRFVVSNATKQVVMFDVVVG